MSQKELSKKEVKIKRMSLVQIHLFLYNFTNIYILGAELVFKSKYMQGGKEICLILI